jgi:hypothetical protein
VLGVSGDKEDFYVLLRGVALKRLKFNHCEYSSFGGIETAVVKILFALYRPCLLRLHCMIMCQELKVSM